MARACDPAQTSTVATCRCAVDICKTLVHGALKEALISPWLTAVLSHSCLSSGSCEPAHLRTVGDQLHVCLSGLPAVASVHLRACLTAVSLCNSTLVIN